MYGPFARPHGPPFYGCVVPAYRSFTRRRFLALIPGATAAAVVAARPAWAGLVTRLIQDGHPTPRAGVNAGKVLTADQLHEADAAPVFDLVREIPQVVDGIRCHCGCVPIPGYYSLLSCYEGVGMAQHCEICQGQARLAHKLHRQGWSLEGIRSAVDAAFG